MIAAAPATHQIDNLSKKRSAKKATNIAVSALIAQHPSLYLIFSFVFFLLSVPESVQNPEGRSSVIEKTLKKSSEVINTAITPDTLLIISGKTSSLPIHFK